MQAAILAIRLKFPSVNHISTDVLAQKLADPRSHVILFDCREQNEFDISHLKDATRLNPSIKAEEARNLAIPSDVTDIVCYCSVGYRSSVVAQLLKSERSSLSVHNLEGSIFKWANERKPMVDQGGNPTQFVHPYDVVFGLLVDKELRKQ